MPTIKLAKPSAGEHVVVPSEPFKRIVLDFSPEHAAMERPEGSDSLLFRFADGSTVELEDFYAQHGKGQLPEFEVNGAAMKGVEFFDAFGPGLEPDEPSGYDASSGHGLKDIPLDEGIDAPVASLEPRPGDAGEASTRPEGPVLEAEAVQAGEEPAGAGIFGMPQAYLSDVVLEDGPQEVDLKEHEDDLLSGVHGEEQEASAGEARSLTDKNLNRDASQVDDGGGSDVNQIAASLHLEAGANVPSSPDLEAAYLDGKTVETQVAMSGGL
jgi:hypothetical protein